MAYVSMHGSTRIMADYFVDALISRGVQVKRFDLTDYDVGDLAESLVDAATLVIGTPTILGGAHPLALYAATLANALRPKTRYASVIGSFGWGGNMLEQIRVPAGPSGSVSWIRCWPRADLKRLTSWPWIGWRRRMPACTKSWLKRNSGMGRVLHRNGLLLKKRCNKNRQMISGAQAMTIPESQIIYVLVLLATGIAVGFFCGLLGVGGGFPWYLYRSGLSHRRELNPPWPPELPLPPHWQWCFPQLFQDARDTPAGEWSCGVRGLS